MARPREGKGLGIGILGEVKKKDIRLSVVIRVIEKGTRESLRENELGRAQTW